MIGDPKEYVSFTLTEPNVAESTLGVWQSEDGETTLLEITQGMPNAEEETYVGVTLTQAAKEFLLQSVFKTVPNYSDTSEERG